jgi:bis(5'-nucleosidyl)-tetraphosphatase
MSDWQSAKKRSAGVVIARRGPRGWRYLLLRCYRYWDFPKGEIESGEDPLGAALREVEEETGLIRLDFRFGQGFYETPAYSGGKVARYYLAVSPSGDVELGVSPELGEPEHHEYRWVSARHGMELLNERVSGVLAWARGLVEEASGEPGKALGRMFEHLPEPRAGEVFETLAEIGGTRVERIVSSPEPEPVLYDQDHDEWVILLRGEARLEVEGREVRLVAGNYLLLPANTRHRVLSTSTDPLCVWLAVHAPRESARGE